LAAGTSSVPGVIRSSLLSVANSTGKPGPKTVELNKLKGR
jgi:hypothetical protein